MRISTSPAAREAVANPDAVVFVSSATIWEIAIQAALGRLSTGGADLVDEIAASEFSELPITPEHAWQAGILPPHHREEGLRCVTRDPAFREYDVGTVW